MLEVFAELETTMTQTHQIAKDTQRIMTDCRRDNLDYGRTHPGSASLLFRQNMLNTRARQYQSAVEEFQKSSEEFKRALSQKISRQAKIGMLELNELLL